MSTVIIYGPQGCGKTRNAQVIAKAFGLTAILDGWHGKGCVPEDTLVLTNVQGIEGARDYYQVMVEVYEKASPTVICIFGISTKVRKMVCTSILAQAAIPPFNHRIAP